LGIAGVIVIVSLISRGEAGADAGTATNGYSEIPGHGSAGAGTPLPLGTVDAAWLGVVPVKIEAEKAGEAEGVAGRITRITQGLFHVVVLAWD
jgi:hypothetical protein